MAHFLWAHNSASKAIHLVAWKDLCKPKEEGGVGLRTLVEWNAALMATRCCKILESHSLLAMWFRMRYLKNIRSFWTATKPWKGSWAWMSLGWGWMLVENLVCWKAGNGEKIRFWVDDWRHGILLHRVQGELYEQIKHDRHLSLKDAINYYRVDQNSFPLLLNSIRELSDRDDRLVFKIDANQEITSSLVWNMLWWARNQAAHDNWQHPSIRSITNRIWKLGQRVAEAIFSQKEEWQLIQLWWSTGILCSKREEIHKDEHTLQVVHSRINLRLMVAAVWWDSDAGTYKAASRMAHGGEDIAEMHLLECWLGKMMNSSGRLTIISSNNGWKRRIRAMIEGRRTIPERWILFRKCYERTSVSNDFPSVDAGQHLLLYGQQDGRNDGG
ncbi:putative ribonuclease H protein [Nymphaea thermarum]|nr:putative ribonuclease H protein [Nymphaea thermarum]